MAVQRVNCLLYLLLKDRDTLATTSPLAAAIAAIEWLPLSHWLRRSLSQSGFFARARFGEWSDRLCRGSEIVAESFNHLFISNFSLSGKKAHPL